MPTDTTGVIVQVNFKDPHGNLYNVYGRDEATFVEGLNILAAYTDKIAEVSSHLNAAGTVASQVQVTAVATPAPVSAPQSPVEAPVAAPQAAPVVSPTPPTQAGWEAPSAAPQAVAKPTCAHGERVGRTGTSAKGEWRAYFCPTAKGTPGQCDPQWVKKGSPEWNSFVAG